MPMRTQSDSATVGQVPTAQELERLWGDLAGDRLAGDPPLYRQSARYGEQICEAIEFDAVRSSPGEARRQVIMALRRRGWDDVPIQDAALLVTELAANAVVHARSSFSVSVSLSNSTLRVDVADSGPIAPNLTSQELVARPGHGLGLIDAICARWGTDPTAHGKVVWGELLIETEGDQREA